MRCSEFHACPCTHIGPKPNAAICCRYKAGTHLFDPTSIMAMVHMSAAKKVLVGKVVYQAAFFFVLFVR